MNDKIKQLPDGKKVAFEADHSDYRGRPTVAMQEICTTDDLKALDNHNAELLKENLRLDSENERLVSELDRKTRALDEAKKVVEHCELFHHRHSGRARKWLEENGEENARP